MSIIAAHSHSDPRLPSSTDAGIALGPRDLSATLAFLIFGNPGPSGSLAASEWSGVKVSTARVSRRSFLPRNYAQRSFPPLAPAQSCKGSGEARPIASPLVLLDLRRQRRALERYHYGAQLSHKPVAPILFARKVVKGAGPHFRDAGRMRVRECTLRRPCATRLAGDDIR